MTTIQDILKREQRIGDNLSSRQMFLVLDDLIARSLEPLADTSPTFLEMSAEILASAVIHRRRITAETQAACFATFFGNKKATCQELTKSGVDRGQVFAYLQRVISIFEKLEKAHVHVLKHKYSRISNDCLVDLSECSRIMGNDPKLIPAIKTSIFWFRQAVDFRDQIVEKYLRLMYKGAVRESRKADFRLEVADLFGASYLSASRAVEKFNSSKGVLTHYISLWLKGVPYDASVQSVGLAYNSRTKKPEDVGWSTTLDKAPHVTDDTAPKPNIESSDAMMQKIMAVAFDPDIRMALAVSGVIPPSVSSVRDE
jgi:hypothetical protein